MTLEIYSVILVGAEAFARGQAVEGAECGAWGSDGTRTDQRAAEYRRRGIQSGEEPAGAVSHRVGVGAGNACLPGDGRGHGLRWAHGPATRRDVSSRDRDARAAQRARRLSTFLRDRKSVV